MKMYISADIEGVAGLTSWSETDLSHRDSATYIKQLAKDINVVCEVATEKGYNEIIINDAHDTGRNLSGEMFPSNVKIIRGWSGHPLCMLEGLDDTFDCVVFVGFHSGAGSNDNPISHTMSNRKVREIKINNKIANEFLIFAYAASYIGVPVVLVTGDQGLCDYVNGVNASIKTVSTKEGFGGATISKHPNVVIEEIEQNSHEILDGDKSKCLINLPEEFEVQVTFKKHEDAYKASFYRDTELLEDGYTIEYKSTDYFDVLVMLNFLAH